MNVKKRSLEHEHATGLDEIHPSRQKRIKYTENNAHLADIYNNLSDEVQSVRIKAAGDLLKNLTTKSSDQTQRLENAEIRLIKGLCSGRKAARLGFSIALAEVFRFKLNASRGVGGDSINLAGTINRIVKLTSPEGNVSGQERRDHFVGRRFAFQAILQSGVALNERLSDEQWQYFIQSIFKLASEKQWLRRECGSMLHEYLTESTASDIASSRLRTIVDELVSAKLDKTSEGVGIWISMQQNFPHVKLPKGIWHHKDPLSSRDLPLLSKILQEITIEDEPSNKKSGSRQASPSFAWTIILSQLYKHGDVESFAKFWKDAVATTMFSSSSSAERKALGLQILSLATSTVPGSMMPFVWGSQNIINCITDQRANPERSLFDAVKVPLNQIITRATQEPDLASVFVRSLLESGRPNFDQLTKLKTVDSTIRLASRKALDEIVDAVSIRIERPSVSDHKEAENHRRILADLLLNTLRAHSQSSELFYESPDDVQVYHLATWGTKLLESLVDYAYTEQNSDAKPEVSKTTQDTFRLRLMSCIGCFLEHTIEKAVAAPLLVVNTLVRISQSEQGLSEQERSTVELATKIVNNAAKGGSGGVIVQSFQLLFSLSIIQVYNGETDGLAALEDLISSYQSLGSSDASLTMLIELLLSFISKPSALFRKLAEQVFSVFAAQLTAESLQSLVDILGQEESLSGQQALFEQERDNNDDNESGSGIEEDDVLDMEDASDIELVNGHRALDEDDDKRSSSDTSSDAEEGSTAGEEDEATVFERKLADALGTARPDDSEDDGSDMDDEQMMALEPHLTSIFKEREQITSKKQDKKDAKENIVNFKNRVLDLLMIYVKTQHSNVVALDLILPLTSLIRTTKSKPTAEKAFAVLKQYYDACSKSKTVPLPQDHEACFEVLKAVHEEMKLGGSKLHASACSRSSLFLSRVIVALEQRYYERISGMYATLQSEWYLDETSKISKSVFTEWTSWSISTRKQL